MSSEAFEYKYYQNFIITWDKFYDGAGRNLNGNDFYYITSLGGRTNQPPFSPSPSGKRGDLGFTPYESNDFNPDNVVLTIETYVGSGIKSNGNLSLYFDISLNPPKNNPKKIVIKNITSSFCTAVGNSFSLICPNVWKFPIQFLDSVNNTIIYEEYRDVQLPTLSAKVNLQRLSGTNPLQTATNPSPYVANPSLNFTIVYEYW